MHITYQVFGSRGTMHEINYQLYYYNGLPPPSPFPRPTIWTVPLVKYFFSGTDFIVRFYALRPYNSCRYIRNHSVYYFIIYTYGYPVIIIICPSLIRQSNNTENISFVMAMCIARNR